METVVEFVSKGTGKSDGTKPGVAYTSDLLEQRPDRVAICGLYISADHFSLVLVDAAKACHTTLPWDDETARKLLFRVLSYINDPPASMIDPTITLGPKGDTFTIKHGDQEYKEYTLKSCGHPIGRRTVVFQCKDPNADVPVIKEQYVHYPLVDDILEKTILDHVHKSEEMPGVVRVSWCGWVKRPDGSSVECGMGDRKRQKVRFLLKDKGTPFMEIATPYDALVAAWDALEGK